MKYEIDLTQHRVTTTHSVSVTVSDVDDVMKAYSSSVWYAPERVNLRWVRYDDDDWGDPTTSIIGRRRFKSGDLGAEVRDHYASIRKHPWLAELAEELRPT